jgi:hypothetical protein
VESITQQINYASVNRGLSYESEGTNRGVPVNFASVAERNFASGKVGTTSYTTATAALPGGTENVLTGTGNHASSDAPDDEQGGYIFGAALAAGKTVRNYGVLVDNIGSIGTKDAPIVQAVANSPFAKDTLLIITEDDCQDGPDHVDSHRASTYVAGAYVKRDAVVSTHYSQINAIHTIEDILGTEHLNLNAAFQPYWDKVTSGFDFSEADRVPTAAFNRVLWRGLMGAKPYPALKNTGPAREIERD